MKTNFIVHSDALSFLQSLPDESVHCIATSPPYFSVRDYGIDGQIGWESSPAKFVSSLTEIFLEAKRVLRSDGTCWINIADTYSAGGRGGQSNVDGDHWQSIKDKPLSIRGLPPKNLCLVPQRLLIALQDSGWIVRSDIIWHKPSCLPESVKDRPTKSYEHVFLIVKSRDYWYDHEAIAEPITDESAKRMLRGVGENHKNIEIPGQSPHTLHQPRKNRKYDGEESNIGGNGTSFNGHSGYRKSDGTLMINSKRNRRDVWTINAASFKGSHFAVFPIELVELMIRAGCPEDGIVLDPFMGSGTTGLIARRLSRNFIGCDLNPQYVAMAEERIANDDPFSDTVIEAKNGNTLRQKSLFGDT